MASGEGIPASGVISEPRKRRRASLENSRKTWGRRQPVKASFMALNRGQPAWWGKAGIALVRPSVLFHDLGQHSSPL